MNNTLADVKASPDKIKGRQCLWCHREKWAPETTPGYKPGKRKRGIRSYALHFPAKPPVGPHTDHVHAECWNLLDDHQRDALRAGKRISRRKEPPSEKDPKRKPQSVVKAHVIMIEVAPSHRACGRCDKTGAFAMQDADWFKAKNQRPHSDGKWFAVEWPAFGLVGQHTDYYHCECWLSWGDEPRRKRSTKFVEDASEFREFNASVGGNGRLL